MATIIPKDIKELLAVAKLEFSWMGTVSSSILGPATEKIPVQNPNKKRPIMIIGRFKNMVSVTAPAANKLKRISILLRPFWINFPPTKDPIVTPKMAAALIMVLNLMASLFVQPNLALITGAV
jgi:hypothetical protein